MTEPLAPSLDSIPHFPKRKEPVGFILRLAKALHQYGVPAYELEATLTDVAKRLGFGLQCLALPTSITISIYDNEGDYTHIIRVAPGDVDIDKLIHVNTIAQQVLRGEMSVVEGANALVALANRQPHYSGIIIAVAFAVMGAALATLFRGNFADIVTGCCCGFLVGGIGGFANRFSQVMHLFPAIAALITGLVTHAVASQFALTSIYVPIIAGLIVLIPGFTLTVAIAELATQNLVSGTARLAAAGVNFMQMGFGVAIGDQLGQLLFGSPLEYVSPNLPDWLKWVAIFFGGICLTVLFQAKLRHLGVIILACFISFSTSSYFSLHLGMVLGAFMGALSITLAANLYARYHNLPNSVMLVPGILLLVPGSIGFKSLTAMLQHH